MNGKPVFTRKPVIHQSNKQNLKDEYLYFCLEESEGKNFYFIPDKERILIEKVLLEGMTYKEIAEQCNMSYALVRSRYIRGGCRLLDGIIKRKYTVDICPYCVDSYKNYYHQNECNKCRNGDIVL